MDQATWLSQVNEKHCQTHPRHPVVLAATAFALRLVLGLERKDLALLIVTFLTSAVTFGSGRTHMMQGAAVHLVIFAAFLFLAFVP
jgi:Ca2+:H+ antiporter